VVLGHFIPGAARISRISPHLSLPRRSPPFTRRSSCASRAHRLPPSPRP